MTTRTATILSRAIRTAAGDGTAAASDRDLLRRFADAGDHEAFAALFRRHSGLVLGVCRRALPNVQDAEDACQATFLVLARKARTGRWQPSLANWLYTTARRVARNVRVTAQRRTLHEGRAAVPDSVQPIDHMTARELLAVLDEELDKLPPRYREPLILCYLQGLTRDEAAARLGVPPATLKSRLERGRKQLGDALTRRGCGAGAGLLALAATSTAEAAPPGLVGAVLAAVAGKAPVAVTRLSEGATTKGVVNKSVAAALLLAGTVALGFGLVSTKPLADRQPRPGDSGRTAKALLAAVANPAADPQGPRLVSGRVLTPDGKPAGGAKLFAPVRKDGLLDSTFYVEWRQVGVTEADGRFAASLPAPAKDASQFNLVVHGSGLGVDWLVLRAEESESVQDVTLRLTEDLPVAGRVVDAEGRPVAGVSVTVIEVRAPGKRQFDSYLAEWAKVGTGIPPGAMKTLYQSPGKSSDRRLPTGTAASSSAAWGPSESSGCSCPARGQPCRRRTSSRAGGSTRSRSTTPSETCDKAWRGRPTVRHSYTGRNSPTSPSGERKYRAWSRTPSRARRSRVACSMSSPIRQAASRPGPTRRAATAWTGWRKALRGTRFSSDPRKGRRTSRKVILRMTPKPTSPCARTSGSWRVRS
jgi:RNA polymerase sigma factor (sigma-70 family)